MGYKTESVFRNIAGFSASLLGLGTLAGTAVLATGIVAGGPVAAGALLLAGSYATWQTASYALNSPYRMFKGEKSTTAATRWHQRSLDEDTLAAAMEARREQLAEEYAAAANQALSEGDDEDVPKEERKKFLGLF